MISTDDSRVLKQQRSLLTISTDALCFAVSSALRFTETPKQMLPTMSDPKAEVATEESAQGLPEISLDQVSWHDTPNDCWIVVYDRVYDVTSFLYEHPGGEEIILEHAGRDATLAFRGVGHSLHAIRALEKYAVGQLPQKERLFQSPNGKLFDTPLYSSSLSLGAGG